MLLPRFDYHAPTSLAEALGILAEYRDRASVLAGGTDLLVDMKKRLAAPSQVVALDQVPGLEDMARTKTEVRIGARTTAAALAHSRVLKKRLGLLSEAAGLLGSPLIRNRATIGGNLAHARPAADLVPPLLALGARVVLAQNNGRRETPLKDFFIGPGQTLIRPEEVLTEVIIPAPEPGTGGAFLKLGVRRALERSTVSAAALITLDSGGKNIKAARMALGAVAPTPIRSRGAEQALIGAAAGEEAFMRAAQAAARDARPRGRRTSPEYSLMMVEVLTRRALGLALLNARQ